MFVWKDENKTKKKPGIAHFNKSQKAQLFGDLSRQLEVFTDVYLES